MPDDLEPGIGVPADDRGPLGLPAILDALTDLVERSRTMPLSSSVLVNRTEALAFLDSAREQLPHQLTHADEVLSDADQTLEAAQAQARRLLAEAREEAERLVARDVVTREAQRQAEAVLAEAEQAAQTLRSQADEYCDRRLAELEIDLGRVLAQVQAGRERLASRLDGE